MDMPPKMESNNSLNDFTVGFWHPFGTHGRESADKIIDRKRNEIQKEGWTFWSFQIRRCLAAWHQEITDMKPKTVLVFCSEGKGSVDPKGEPQLCQTFQNVDEKQWQKIPDHIKIPHPMGRKHEASAFIVEDIIDQFESIQSFQASWRLKDGTWRKDRVPTRGEYLIRRDDGGSMIRAYRAILVLKAPYLATVGTGELARI